MAKDPMRELVEEVEAAGGVLAVQLGDLRDAVGADKLGKLVIERIKNELSSAGLGYFPQEVLDQPTAPRQNHDIRLYRRGNNAAARAIEAVITPSRQGDAFLSDLASNDAQDTLARIRELVSAE